MLEAQEFEITADVVQAERVRIGKKTVDVVTDGGTMAGPIS